MVWIGDPTTHNGDWDVAANWSTGAVPINFQDVVLDAAGATVPYTITKTSLSQGQYETIDSLFVDG